VSSRQKLYCLENVKMQLVGVQSLFQIHRKYNTAFGVNSLYLNSIGSNNTGIGNRSLFNSSGSSNTASGYTALLQIQPGELIREMESRHYILILRVIITQVSAAMHFIKTQRAMLIQPWVMEQMLLLVTL